MSVTFAPATVQEALNADPEFRLVARLWTVRIKLRIGENPYFIRIVDGVVVDILDVPTGFDTYDIEVGGTEEQWELLMAATPVPFYQDFYSAFFRHDFVLGGNLESLYAYYAAVRRMGQILRTIHNREPST